MVSFSCIDFVLFSHSEAYTSRGDRLVAEPRICIVFLVLFLLSSCCTMWYRILCNSPPPPSTNVPANSSPAPSSPPTTDLPPASPPIALRKGTCFTHNPHPIYNFLSYHHFSTPYFAFITSLPSISIPKTDCEALNHPGRRHAMVDEMVALHSTDIWDLVSLPPGKTVVGCRWV